MTHRNSDWMRRRDVLALVVGGSLTARAQVSAPAFSALDHIEFVVSDVEKSRDFYTRIFGNTLLKGKNGPKRYLKLGSTYIAIEPPSQARPEVRVDHVCVAIKNFNIAAFHTYLEQRGIAYRDYPSGRDTAVTDLDGTRIQLASEDGWSVLSGPAAPESIPAVEPVFRPIGLDHVLLNVSDPEKSAAFYEKFLGPVAERRSERIWFQVGTSRLGLVKTPSGQRAGLNHFCVSASRFEAPVVTRKLEQLGAKMQPSEAADSPQFRDPDGYLVQVLTR